MKYIDKYNKLKTKAVEQILALVDNKGVDSDHVGERVLKITDVNLMYNVSNSYVTEVWVGGFIDKNGDQYCFDCLEDEQFFDVVDHLIEVYANNELECDRIVVDIKDGDIFNGSRLEFRNCFFDNASNFQIIDWCKQQKFTSCTINGIEQLEKEIKD